MGFGEFLIGAGIRLAFIIGGLTVALGGLCLYPYIGYGTYATSALGLLMAAYGVFKKRRDY